MIKIDLKRHKREVIGAVIVLLLLLGGVSVFKYTSFNTGFEITDDLGGNIFPSAILSVATTDAQVIIPSDSTYLGNPKSCIAVRLKSKTAYSRVRIEVAETPFFFPLRIGVCIEQTAYGVYGLSGYNMGLRSVEEQRASRAGKRCRDRRDEREGLGTTGTYFLCSQYQ